MLAGGPSAEDDYVHYFRPFALRNAEATAAGVFLSIATALFIACMAASVSLDETAFTVLANATGQPAISLPLHWTAEGLPVGSHFTSRPGREDVLLALAGQLERSRPWAQRWPPLVPRA